MSLLELKDVSKVFGREAAGASRRLRPPAATGAIRALDHVDLSVGKGEAVALVGESGAGKTTLASLAAGLARPCAGRVSVAGFDPAQSGGLGANRRAARLERARRLQLIWQDARGSLDPRMRIAAAVAEPLRIHRLAPRTGLGKKVDVLLREVGLDAGIGGRYPHELSGGELQRVVIARALALNPAVLVCDEPAASLDAGNKVRIARLLTRLRRQRGLALLVISHDLPLVRFLAQTVHVIYRGRIVESGPVAAVIDKPLHPYTKLLVGCDPSSVDWEQMLGDVGQIGAAGTAQREPGGGCGYAARCGQKDERCLQESPKLRGWPTGRQVACHRRDSAADVLQYPVERLTGVLQG